MSGDRSEALIATCYIQLRGHKRIPLIERGVQGRVVGNGKSDQAVEKPRVASLSQNETFLLLELKDSVGVREHEVRLVPQSYSACEGEARQGGGLRWVVAIIRTK